MKAASLAWSAFCALVYFFLMLPLLVVFPISLSSAPYMQFPPPGLSAGSGTSAISTIRSGSTPPCARCRSASRRRCWRCCSACRSRSPWCAAASSAGARSIGSPWRRSSCRTIIISIAVYGLFAQLKLIGEWYGLVVAHTVLALPFVVLVMSAGLRDFDRSLEQAAESLGASPLARAEPRHAADAAAEPRVGGPARLHLVVRRGRGGAVPVGRRT